ncbi:MAG: hypothetical protein M0035_08110 [Actinomycetota bacterium]|nr:hypothetical protein [Actinomycetota bacterium]
MHSGEEGAVALAIERFAPRCVSEEAARFARELVAAARPTSVNRAKALLFATSRLGAFGESVGLALTPEVLLSPSVVERCCTPEASTMSAATRRTLRSNLRAIARCVAPMGPSAPRLSRERAKAPYTKGEIEAYLALADAQPTESRRLRASALICLCAGAGLVGADLKAVLGSDVVVRSVGVVVCVRQGRCPRVVPVLSRYHPRLLAAARVMGTKLLIGGTSSSRRNVTTPITSSLAGGSDLPRLEIARLRATWLCEVAGGIGLRAFMEAAGITCSQRLGDLVAHIDEMTETRCVALLGGSS